MSRFKATDTASASPPCEVSNNPAHNTPREQRTSPIHARGHIREGNAELPKVQAPARRGCVAKRPRSRYEIQKHAASTTPTDPPSTTPLQRDARLNTASRSLNSTTPVAVASAGTRLSLDHCDDKRKTLQVRRTTAYACTPQHHSPVEAARISQMSCGTSCLYHRTRRIAERPENCDRD